MKTKFIVTSLALAGVFAACSNDELVNVEAGMPQSEMIELGENFMIGGAGVENMESRTHWYQSGSNLYNAFIPVGVGTTAWGAELTANSSFNGLEAYAPSIGLCWIGQSLGTNVYTNYEFIHKGWLGKAQTAPIFDECSGELKNGWFYDDVAISSSAAPAAGVEFFAATSELSGDNRTPNANTTLLANELNLNSGVYKTENKSIFGGQYIAYFPYNDGFVDAGTIPAKSAVEFNAMNANEIGSVQISENTFRYSNVVEINGGAKADGFGFNNLSGVIRINLKSKSTTALTEQVEKILLYSKTAGFKKEVRLNASAIAAGLKGTQLYTETVESSKTILINMANPITPVASNATNVTSCVYITALPTTVTDLTVLAYAGGKWAEANIGNFVIPAGQGAVINASFATSDFKQVYYAVDQATLNQAIVNASTVATSSNKVAIKALGDIKLSTSVTLPAYVTLEGDDIIVPEGVNLTVSQNATVKSNIILEGETCCNGSSSAGNLLTAGIIDGDVTVLASEKTGGVSGVITTFDGAEFTANSVITSIGKIEVYGTVDVKGQLNVKPSSKLTVYDNGDLNIKGATLNNEGTIEVLGKFAMLDASGSTTAAAGLNFNNNGKFIDNVGATIGGGTQYMIFGASGQYICRVDGQNRLNEAYINKTACSVIEFVNAGANYNLYYARMHNSKHVDIIVNATSDVTFKPSAKVTIGNLTINSALTIARTTSYTSGSTTYYTEIAVAGDIKVNKALTVESDVRNFTANNMTVYANGSVSFANRVSSMAKTMAVSGTIEVKQNGSFTIIPKTGSNNVAYVTCKKLIEGGTFVGKPDVIL